MMGKLYRGVSKTDDEKLNGKLLPKGDVKEVAMKYGDPVSRYRKVTYGPSETNIARSHQVESGMHNGCCISVTRDQSVAENFATSGKTEDGYVYVINEDYLDQYNITKYEFIDPEYPHEYEVSLIAEDGGEIAPGVVFGKYEINHT